MKKILVAGAGGFIGGHLVKELQNRGYKVRAVDIKLFDDWYQLSGDAENHVLDMSLKENCFRMVDGVDEVINMACNMGGMGFIENNKALCMLSVLVNTHLLMACKEYEIKKYFFSSSACAYNKDLQNDVSITGLREKDAYPANPEDGYGWEKLFSERMCRHFFEDYGLDVKVARYHNIFGPHGTYDGGREKAPAALCRKIINSIINKQNIIDVWGDGEQTRSFLFIDDCIEATLKLFNSEYHGPINIGSEEKVSINEMIDKIEIISNKKVERNYQLDKPKGVRGRNSNNDLIRKQLNWEPKFDLQSGLDKTYHWILSEIKKKHNQ
jgi:GDP-D-mannose 3',5'-epimerase